MSMTKRKPVQVIEYRISLQDKQSEQLDSLIAAIQFKQISSGVGSVLEGLGVPEIAKDLNDPVQITQTFYSIAIILEFLGIETGLPTPADAIPYLSELQKYNEEKWAKAGKKTKWWNPASWKVFDYIGDWQSKIITGTERPDQ
jgi:hypothetical protein